MENVAGAGVGHESENTLRTEQACGSRNGEAISGLAALHVRMSVTWSPAADILPILHRVPRRLIIVPYCIIMTHLQPHSHLHYIYSPCTYCI